MKLLVICLISLQCVYYAATLRVLSVMPTVTRSHYGVQRRLIYELLERGHEVVSISPYEENITSKNFTWVEVEVKSFAEAVPNLNEELTKTYNFFGSQKRLWNMTNDYTRYIINKPKLRRFIENDKSHFDVLLIKEFFNPIFYVFAHKYNAPFITISTFGSAHFISQYMGNSLEMSYVPHEFIELYGELNFYDRMKNAVSTVYDVVGRHLYVVETQNAMVKEVFKDLKDVPHLADLERQAALTFINSHFSINVIRPFLPNMIEIAGIHIQDVKPLKQDLKLLLDTATEGVIYFSFGSVMDLSILPDDVIVSVLNMLGKLKQRVLLKWASDKRLPVTHDNVYSMSWLPQNDILAHPNVVLFVTHGGLSSSLETLHHGVPTVCMPFLGDQPLNCKRSVQLGYGLKLEKDELGTPKLYDSIKEIIENKKYRTNVKMLSDRFRDRQSSALDTAVYWIEYCGRHDTRFLSSPRRKLYWFQYYFIDALLVVAAVLYILYKLIYILISSLFRSKSKIKTN